MCIIIVYVHDVHMYIYSRSEPTYQMMREVLYFVFQLQLSFQMSALVTIYTYIHTYV